MEKGKVKWYDEVKGFGFIETKDKGDIFVHRTSLVSPFSGLETDQSVEFEVKEGQKGLVAVNVKSAD
jgi:CspA family cold shock protein